LTEEYKTISEPIRGPKLIEKKSIFIGSIYPIRSISEFDDIHQSIKIEFHKASHNAYAYRLYEDGLLKANFHDDGEQKGTAGRLILQHLENYDIVNAALFVTRFYGGINLGRGGLIRSYSKTAKDLLDNVKLVTFNENHT
jgi:putative IMPACT (imprinted ancient) family translation regulator